MRSAAAARFTADTTAETNRFVTRRFFFFFLFSDWTCVLCVVYIPAILVCPFLSIGMPSQHLSGKRKLAGCRGPPLIESPWYIFWFFYLLICIWDFPINLFLRFLLFCGEEEEDESIARENVEQSGELLPNNIVTPHELFHQKKHKLGAKKTKITNSDRVVAQCAQKNGPENRNGKMNQKHTASQHTHTHGSGWWESEMRLNRSSVITAALIPRFTMAIYP